MKTPSEEKSDKKKMTLYQVSNKKLSQCTNEKHRCRARARQEGQHRKTGPGLSSMGEALSVKQDRKLAGEVEGA